MDNRKIIQSYRNKNEEYINEAQAYKPKRSRWIKWGTAATCLCLAIALLFALPHEKSPKIISEYKTERASNYSHHSTPAPGTYFCYVDVNMARKYYSGENIVFLLALDIYNASDEEKAAEYQRLVGLGYKLYEAERWTYSENGEKKYETVVAGTFTEAELSDFVANEKYGYVFHFISNGDGSGISAGEDDLITEFYITVGTAVFVVN